MSVKPPSFDFVHVIMGGTARFFSGAINSQVDESSQNSIEYSGINNGHINRKKISVFFYVC